jgi:hypothetical protein
MAAIRVALNVTWSAYSADLRAILGVLAYRTHSRPSGYSLRGSLGAKRVTQMRALPIRALIVISIAIGVIFYPHSRTPTEIQMRDAFEHYLVDQTAQTAQTVQFIQETAGASAVERVKAIGNDRFEIRAFRKLECQQAREKPGFDCMFNVDIDLANGMMHRALEGRFYNTSMGTAFELVEQSVRASFASR